MDLLELLKTRIDEVRAQVRLTDAWRRLTSLGVADGFSRAILRELFRDIATYQWFTTRAGFKMIGSLPARDKDLMKTLLMHKWEEVEHREWAFQCYQALGGENSFVDSRRAELTPSASSIAACWEWMADHLDPFAYLGAEYLFEKLTAELSREIVPSLERSGIERKESFFIAEHVEEDAKHALLFDGLIKRASIHCPQKTETILGGFDHFRQVYPIPAWNEIYERAKTSVQTPDKCA